MKSINAIAAPDVHHQLSFPFKGGKHFFMPEQIIRLQAVSNYTCIHLIDHKAILMAKVLATYEILLQPFGFIRTHKSHLVNKKHIKYVDQNGEIVMDDESKAEISRRKKREVWQSLLNSNHSAA